MKKRVICLMVLCLFLLSNTALATNWVYIFSFTEFPPKCDVYLDIDSVTKSGDTITYWELEVYEKPLSDGKKQFLQKWEAKQPRMFREIALYQYDLNKREVGSWPNLQNNFESYNDNPRGKVADEAFKYAKEGKVTGQKPTLP